MSGAKNVLTTLGAELDKLYTSLDLAASLGQYKPAVLETHTKRQDSPGFGAPPLMSMVNWPEAYIDAEEAYIHFLRMIAYAVDDAYHMALNECIQPYIVDKKLFHHNGLSSIKGYVRMRNKMLSKEDHRYREKPRPAHNVDINRALAAVKTP